MSTPLTDAAVGDVLFTREIEVSRDRLVRYASVSGDFNPIHYNDAVATSVGLPGVIAHGMLTMGIAVETIMPWLGDAGRIVEYGARFTRPVVVDAQDGADLVIVAKVGALDEDIARIDLTVTFADTAVLGKTQVRVRLGG